MSIFEQIIPLPNRLQWLMLKTAIEQDCNAHMIASRLGWSASKVIQTIWGNPGKFRLDRVASWFFACGGLMPKFTIIREEIANGQE